MTVAEPTSRSVGERWVSYPELGKDRAIELRQVVNIVKRVRRELAAPIAINAGMITPAAARAAALAAVCVRPATAAFECGPGASHRF